MSNRMARMDFGLFCVVLLMLGFGIVIVYSSSFALSKLRFGGSDVYLSQQAIRAILALASFMFFINVDYHIWGKLGNAIYFFSVILLIAVLIPSIGEEINGARRWISIRTVRFQVSELAGNGSYNGTCRNCEKAGPEIKKWPVLSRCLVCNRDHVCSDSERAKLFNLVFTGNNSIGHSLSFGSKHFASC